MKTTAVFLLAAAAGVNAQAPTGAPTCFVADQAFCDSTSGQTDMIWTCGANLVATASKCEDVCLSTVRFQHTWRLTFAFRLPAPVPSASRAHLSAPSVRPLPPPPALPPALPPASPPTKLSVMVPLDRPTKSGPAAPISLPRLATARTYVNSSNSVPAR